MRKRLLRRNILLLIGVVLAGQLLAGLLVMTLVIRPQIDRVAGIGADTISALSDAIEVMPPGKRNAMIERVNRQGNLRVLPRGTSPSDGRRFPTMVERQFMRAVAERLSRQERLNWRTDQGGRLWVQLVLGSEQHWVSLTPPGPRGALTSLIVSFAIAFIVAAAGGLVLQRRLDAPLRRLSAEVDAYRPEGAQTHAPLRVDGPEEIAAVASAFNRLTGRIAEQESERALMLAGVSHDMRTPLTRLRLALEMMHGRDAELEASAERQVDVIETMLGQFLDFARGFEAELPARVDLVKLAAKVIADCSAEDKVALGAAPGVVATLRPSATERAIANLLGNALRHGAPPITLTVVRHAEGVRVTVHDAGPGFGPEQAVSLLRPFARGDSARSGQGTGLGLAIVQRIAEAHAGTLSFERSNDGFEATIDLPDAPIRL